MAVAAAPAASQTRERLLDATARIIVRDGYQGGRIADVAREAGLTTGAIYSNFRNKEDLFLAAFSRMQEMTQGMLVPLEGARTMDGMVRAFGAILDQFRASPELRILNFELGLLGSRDPRIAAELKRGLAETTDAVADTIPSDRELSAKGIPFQRRELATVLLALNNGLALMEMFDPDVPGPDLAERTIRRLVAGVMEKAEQ
jgi:AcrR family transcriptional regulator